MECNCLPAFCQNVARCNFHAACGRVHAATRLGWTRNRGAYAPLGAVRPDGGIVPRTLVVIQRRLQVGSLMRSGD